MDTLPFLYTYLQGFIQEELRQLYMEIGDNILLVDPDSNFPSDVAALISMTEEGNTQAFLNDLNNLYLEYLTSYVIQMGVVLDKDEVTQQDISTLNDILNTVLLTIGVEDPGDLAAVFDDDELSDAEKVVALVDIITCKQHDDLIDKISWVNPLFLVGVRQGLFVPEEPAALNNYIVSRLRLNLDPQMETSLGMRYLAAQGELGVELDSLLDLNKNALRQLAEEDSNLWYESAKALVLISNTPNDKVSPVLIGLISEQYDNLVDQRRLLEYVDQLKFEVV